MPTTSVYGLPYLEMGDPPDLPQATQDLAEAVEATLQGSLALGGGLTVPGDLTLGGGEIVGNVNVVGNLSATGIGQVQLVRKTADETVTNSITLQNDNHLFVPVVANAAYAFDLFLVMIASNNNSQDFKYGFTFPAGSTIRYASLGLANSLASGSAGTLEAQADANPATFGASTSPTHAMVRGTLVTAANAGTLQFQWAQFVANNNTTLGINSWMRSERFG